MPTHFNSRFLDDIMDDVPDARRVEPAGTVSNVQTPAFEVPGGDGAPGPRERRRQLLEERRQLRIDTGELDRPSFDRDQSRLNQIVTGVGALGGLVAALGGSEIGASAGAGLAQGGARNLQRQRKSFRRRQEAFQERLSSARQYNREVGLSVNEAQVRGAEGEIERQREEELIKLRDRLENKLTPQERKKVQKELDLLDKRIQARGALTTERQTQAEANRALAEERRRPDTNGGGDEDNPYRDLSDTQITSLIERSRSMLEQGFPPAIDTDQSGDLSTTELFAAEKAGVSLPSSADVDRVAERMSALRAEAQRRGILEEDGGSGGGTSGDRGTGGGQQRTQRGGRRSQEPTMGQPERVFPARERSRGQGRGSQRQGGGGRQQPRDVSDQLPSDLEGRIRSQIPSDVNLRDALNAAALVRSDTTTFTPANYETQFGFNPFQ